MPKRSDVIMSPTDSMINNIKGVFTMDQERIGKFITTLRKEKGLTQEQLAEKLNVNNKTVSRWETGKNMPDYSILESLTDELGITVNELIRGERIIKEEIIQEYDHNLVEVLKEYKHLKKAKNTILILLLILSCVVGVVTLFAIGISLSVATMISAQIEINEDISLYLELIGPNARKEYRDKLNMDESIFPEQITGDMQVADYKMVYYNPWDPQWLSYLVVDYDDSAWENELDRLKNYDSTEYIGYYGTTGFSQYDLLAIYAGEEYEGLVYALADLNSQQVIYVEIIFCNYFMDIDYEEYIADDYLPDGFDATNHNSIRRKYDREHTILHFQT